MRLDTVIKEVEDAKTCLASDFEKSWEMVKTLEKNLDKEREERKKDKANCQSTIAMLEG